MSQSLKVVFAGTPEFATKSLLSVLNSKHQVIAVYTQPDRPSGRGQKIKFSPVKDIALQHEIPIYQPDTFNQQACEELKDLNADVMLVSAYGLILPEAALNAPKYGCINIHASLLPKWRGAAPIERAILKGDTTTGITIMQVIKSLDAGPILFQSKCEIKPTDTGASLRVRLAQLSATEIVGVLDKLQNGELKPIAQDSDKATYASKIEKQEAQINWQDSAIEIERKVRAFNSWPVAYTNFKSKRLRVWEAKAFDKTSTHKPGEIISATKAGIEVATAKGVLNLLTVQLAGGKLINAQDFTNAHDLQNQHFDPVQTIVAMSI